MQNVNELVIDPEVNAIMPLLSDEEFEQLRQNILSDGKVTDPIIVWGNKIVDGHNRWKIIQEHPEIPYTIEYMEFPDEDAAVQWACFHQAGRRNLNRQEMKYIIGIASIRAKRSIGAPIGNQNAKQTCQIDTFVSDDSNKDTHKTWNETAETFGVTPSFVRHAEDITKAVDLADEVVPGFREKYKAGDIKASDNFIEKAMKVPEENRAEVAEAILAVNTDNTKEENQANKEYAQSLVSQYIEHTEETDKDDVPFDEDEDETDNFENSEGMSYTEWLKDHPEEGDISEFGEMAVKSSWNFENFRSTLEKAISDLSERIEITDFKDEIFANEENQEIIDNLISDLFDIITDLRKKTTE